MWCIWKARNDLLFNKKDCLPTHIKYKAQAINQNLEKMEIVQVQVNGTQEINKTSRTQDAEEELAGIKQGDTINNDMAIQTNKIYTNAAWKPKKVSRFQGENSYRNWCLLSTPTLF
jgi:hypothetical protein